MCRTPAYGRFDERRRTAQLRARLRWLGTPWLSAALETGATHVVVQTVQRETVHDDLVRTGVHRPPRWGDDHDFAEAYGWIAQQMTQRLPTEGDGIVWTWAQCRRRDLKSMTLSRGDVLLRCRVPRERVLVSHFSDWHCVLNRMLIVEPLPGEDDESYKRRADPLFDAYFERLAAAGVANSPVGTWPSKLREEVETSWEAIFDSKYWPARGLLQATLHEIRASDVIEAIRFR